MGLNCEGVLVSFISRNIFNFKIFSESTQLREIKEKHLRVLTFIAQSDEFLAQNIFLLFNCYWSLSWVDVNNYIKIPVTFGNVFFIAIINIVI